MLAVEAHGADAPAKFLGAQSCASTGCHGGGGTKQNQFLVWSVKDFHSQRPTATLTTARSKQIAEALDIKDPTADTRCTSCHAPLHDVPENLRGEFFKASEGVSCESCHGPAENWLRSHTRHDYTRADRTASGLRDLQNLYVRANTCVACHQVVSQPLLKAGHPELIFELDGQSVAEPKHWQESTNWSRAHSWYVGQAVALREMSWQLAQSDAPAETETQRWAALLWLLNWGEAKDAAAFAPTRDNFLAVQTKWDGFARQVAAANPAAAGLEPGKVLRQLAGVGPQFLDATVPAIVHARRAERLVLALDRLTVAENNHKADAELNQLFKLAQSLPDFDPKAFAAALDKFKTAME